MQNTAIIWTALMRTEMRCSRLKEPSLDISHTQYANNLFHLRECPRLAWCHWATRGKYVAWRKRFGTDRCITKERRLSWIIKPNPSPWNTCWPGCEVVIFFRLEWEREANMDWLLYLIPIKLAVFGFFIWYLLILWRQLLAARVRLVRSCVSCSTSSCLRNNL